MATMWTLSRPMNAPRCWPSLLSGFAETWWNSSTAISRSSKAPTPYWSTANRNVAWVQTSTLSSLSRNAPTDLTLPPLSEPGALQRFHFGCTVQSAQKPNWLRSEEHTSELQSLMRISYAVFCLKTKQKTRPLHIHNTIHTDQ